MKIKFGKIPHDLQILLDDGTDVTSQFPCKSISFKIDAADMPGRTRVEMVVIAECLEVDVGELKLTLEKDGLIDTEHVLRTT